MTLVARIISQFTRRQSDEMDAFEKRLNTLGQQSKRRSRVARPSLFNRQASVA